MPSGFRMTGNWNKLRMLLHPGKFSARLKKEVKKATAWNAAYVAKAARKQISKGMSPANAALTQLIKGQNKPLIDSSAMWDSIWFQLLSWQTAFVGVLRTSDSFNVAEIVHDGSAVKVTQRMRAMFRWLYWASTGKVQPNQLTGAAAELWQRNPAAIWRPLRASTEAIIIPARPFMANAFDDGDVAAVVISNWHNAVDRALTG